MHRRRPLMWVALVGIGLAGVVAASAAAASAAMANAVGSAASPFELVFTGRSSASEDLITVGTFTSGEPFCESGSTEDVGWFQRLGDPGVVRRYTCADGSGSLLLSISSLQAEHTTGSWGEWAIVEGSGRYEGLRGKGTYWGELLSGNPAQFEAPFVFRTIARGFVAADATPPSTAITSASATKLRGSPGAYSIRVALSLRDDIDGNTVAYRLKVTQGRIEVASKEGATASGSVLVTLRVEPFRKPLRNVGLYLRASDPNGNERFVYRLLKLAR